MRHAIEHATGLQMDGEEAGYEGVDNNDGGEKGRGARDNEDALSKNTSLIIRYVCMDKWTGRVWRDVT